VARWSSQDAGPTRRDSIIKPDGIVDPDGKETSRAQLHSYFWIVQFARRLAYDREDPALHRDRGR
jgi:hypothetical protein